MRARPEAHATGDFTTADSVAKAARERHYIDFTTECGIPWLFPGDLYARGEFVHAPTGFTCHFCTCEAKRVMGVMVLLLRLLTCRGVPEMAAKKKSGSAVGGKHKKNQKLSEGSAHANHGAKTHKRFMSLEMK
jgi:hypothetical protein